MNDAVTNEKRDPFDGFCWEIVISAFPFKAVLGEINCFDEGRFHFPDLAVVLLCKCNAGHVHRPPEVSDGSNFIDLNKVSSLQAEMWKTAPRMNGVQGLPFHRSFWAEEVTIYQQIPIEAILGQ